jgi:hypothetical protein
MIADGSTTAALRKHVRPQGVLPRRGEIATATPLV